MSVPFMSLKKIFLNLVSLVQFLFKIIKMYLNTIIQKSVGLFYFACVFTTSLQSSSIKVTSFESLMNAQVNML